MSTRNLPWGKGSWQISLTTSVPSVSCLENAGALISHNPVGPHSLIQRSIYIYLLPINNWTAIAVFNFSEILLGGIFF